MSHTRRKFILTTGTTAAVLSGCGPSKPEAWRPAISQSIKGSNDDIRIALIGMGRRSEVTLNSFSKMPGVRVVALCDPDEAQIAKRVKTFSPSYTYDTYTDLRHVMDHPYIDAVAIQTSNHWHSLAAIWACQSGKDVYVEKPISHTLWEGRQLVNAKDKYGRIVQSGTQNRSDVGLRPMFEWLHAGNLGAIKSVRGLCYRNRSSIGKIDHPLVPPATCNYDLWLGPRKTSPSSVPPSSMTGIGILIRATEALETRDHMKPTSFVGHWATMACRDP